MKTLCLPIALLLALSCFHVRAADEGDSANPKPETPGALREIEPLLILLKANASTKMLADTGLMLVRANDASAESGTSPSLLDNVRMALGGAEPATSPVEPALATAEEPQQTENRPALSEYVEGLRAANPGALSQGESPNDDLVSTLVGRMVRVETPDAKESSSFFVDRQEITRGEWALVMNEPIPSDADHPVDGVSYSDVQRFVERLNAQIGPRAKVFRLPTESEWELAAAGGSADAKSFVGKDRKLDEFAWYASNSEKKSHPVGALSPNAIGLLDVYGNVAEWCEAETSERTDQQTSSYESDVAPTTNSAHTELGVVRGGNYLNSPAYCTTKGRYELATRDRLRGVGFRLVATTESQLPLSR